MVRSMNIVVAVNKLTLNAEDDCIGVLHVGLTDAEDGFFSI